MNVNMKLNIFKELDFLITIRNDQKVKRAEKAYDLISAKGCRAFLNSSLGIYFFILYIQRKVRQSQSYIDMNMIQIFFCSELWIPQWLVANSNKVST